MISAEHETELDRLIMVYRTRYIVDPLKGPGVRHGLQYDTVEKW